MHFIFQVQIFIGLGYLLMACETIFHIYFQQQQNVQALDVTRSTRNMHLYWRFLYFLFVVGVRQNGDVVVEYMSRVVVVQRT